ncbi:hypothetical protein, partial [Streptomyces sp. Amel2xB2]|uniref:hypothetical protein n=1 Tax=Streptomyces sp. Amel2xB2 TaxID=1305829 RepID=UPI0021AD06BB
MIRKPRMRPQRQPTGEQHPVALGQFDGGTEQRMLGGAQPEPGSIAASRGDGGPEALVLERVRRQIHPPG